MQRSDDGKMTTEKVPRSFDISLKHRFNALSSAVHNNPSLPNFCTPPSFTGELIGMQYLRLQNGDCSEVVELNEKIDEAFVDFNLADEEEEDILGPEPDETVVLPEYSSDSGNEVIEVDAQCLIYTKIN